MEEVKEYTGTAYIGVVGSGLDYAICRDSISKIAKRQGDTGPHFIRATKGYEARQQHLNIFIESGQQYIMLLDADMVFEPNTLEQMRSHKLPYVSGLYMRRNWTTLGTVWYREFKGDWPMEPFVGKIKADDKLYKLGASGWGCILLHRDVVLAVRELLKGEWEVFEDDMDIFPYNLKQIMRAINGLDNQIQFDKPIDPALIKGFVEILQNEIRPLRADRGSVGSDIRFPFFAREAGYQLMGDPSVRPGHVTHFPIDANMYELNFDKATMEEARKSMRSLTVKERRVIRKQLKAVQNA